ncbi:PucR family transcriptional regulator [Nocardia asteroides]|uniref:PucR family transcriptional regulator n=1 Tax=Nocardia asteroides TaxID=1824 RepID=UPI001E4BF423|nr:helix-turn-helix domain-containing protein [Nocardia asteroides]UGT61842.1 helix-turn-helix domain-containing protein [Nocardia asteroides]
MPHWSRGLAPSRIAGDEPEWLGSEADRVRNALGSGAVLWAVEVGQNITARIAQALPELGEGPSALGAVLRATTSTTLQALTLVASIGEQDASLASREVTEIAGEFARRGMELNDLLRSIRVGYAVLAAALLDGASELLPPEQSSAELRRISVLLFEVLDDFTGVAATAFVAEQSSWAAGVSAARLELATTIINGEPVDAARAAQVLSYPLTGQHVAMIAWGAPQSRHDLRSVVEPVLRRWGTLTATLVIPVGVQAIWAWGCVVPDQLRPLHPPVPHLGEAWAVAGELDAGVEGFRRSHLEARAVERLVRMREQPEGAVTAHEDVALEVLLLAEPEAATRFVDRVLGPLGADDPRMADLRSTLRRYLDLDHSLAQVAAAEHISKNTVTYRVQRALSLCGHSGSSTTNLRSALRIHDWLNPPSTDQR